MNYRQVLLAICLALAGCSSPQALGTAGVVSVVPTGELPAPGPRDSVSAAREYRIGAFDRLMVDVFGMPELSGREVQTDSAGQLSFPLAGTIDAAGLTPAELSIAIAERLRAAHVRDPQVSVNLKESLSQMVTVDGQVRQPGMYPALGNMTLMRAIATARGLDEYAKLNDVVVFRTVEGRKLAALYNLEAIRRGNYEDPPIYGNDVVIVGDSKARRLFKDLLQVLPLLTTPIIVALQNSGN